MGGLRGNVEHTDDILDESQLRVKVRPPDGAAGVQRKDDICRLAAASLGGLGPDG